MAVLAVRNEELFIGACLENLYRQGVEVYLCDNDSTDRTLEIAERHRGRGLAGLERIPYSGMYRWERILRRKEELFQNLEADWLMHVDADEIHLPRPGHRRLVDSLAEADARGYDAVEFREFTFVPTREAPNHEHVDFQRTMRWYYQFRPRSPHCVRAFKKRRGPIEIAWSGGHRVRFATPARIDPEPSRFRHYLFLSESHAVRKYAGRLYDPHAVRVLGWHDWRARLRPEHVRLPGVEELRVTASDDDLESSEPWTEHWLARCVPPEETVTRQTDT
jgi:hypothetical protein